MRGLLFAFVLLSLAFAAPATLPNLDPVHNPLFIGSVILLSVAFVALAYAVSSAIQNPSAIAWSKDQLRELIIGVVIVVFVYGANVTANNMVTGMTGYDNAVALGSAALDPLIGNLTIVYSKIGEAYFSVAVQQGTNVGASFGMPPLPTPTIFMPHPYYSTYTMPFYGLSPILQTLTIAAQNITIQMLSFKVVQLLLIYIEAVVPGFLLPIGFAFRVFPLTKKIGDTLIALSLGGLFMLPASLVVVNELNKMAPMDNVKAVSGMGFSGNMDPMFFSGANFMKEGFCENTAMRVITGFGEVFWSIIFAIIASAPEFFTTFVLWFNFFGGAVWPWIVWVMQTVFGIILIPYMFAFDAGATYDTTIQPIISYLIPAAAEITAFSIISVIVIAMITYTGTKSISIALGGEYAFYGLTRLI